MVRKAVGAVILNMRNEVLLVHKTCRGGEVGKKVSIDIWDFVKGGVKDKEDNKDAILREIDEELGIKDIGELLELEERICFNFSEEEKKDLGYESQETMMYLVKINEDSAFHCVDDEVDQFIFFPVNDVREQLSNVETRIFWEKILKGYKEIFI